jgi:hypothetical protein
LGCVVKRECLCLTHDCCCAPPPVKPYGCGLITDTSKNDKECCRIGLHCCACGLQSPAYCCAEASKCCCLEGASSLPCGDEYLGECVCACYFLQCAPKCGCCAPPPDCPALDKMLGRVDIPSGEQMKR